MRQAYLTAPRRIEWRERPTQQPGPGELLVRIRAALTCGTDLKTYRRGHPKLQYGPFGHEASGDVIAAGEGVENFGLGDAVMWVQTAPCGQCAQCLSDDENLCNRLFDDIALGAYGDELLLPAKIVRQNVYRMPENRSYIEAAFLEPLACIVHGWNVLRRADMWRPMPESVAIIGAGTMGLLHLAQARRMEAPATVVARGEQRRAIAQSMGAQATIDADDGAAIESLSGSFDAVIESAGTAKAWERAVALARPGGRVLFFSGLPAGTHVRLDATRVHYSEIRCMGAFHFTPRDVREAAQWLSDPALDVKRLLSGVELLDRLVEVFERLDRREGYKFALVPNGAAKTLP